MIFSKYYYDKSLLGGKSKILRIYIAVAQICGLAKKKKKKSNPNLCYVIKKSINKVRKCIYFTVPIIYSGALIIYVKCKFYGYFYKFYTRKEIIDLEYKL